MCNVKIYRGEKPIDEGTEVVVAEVRWSDEYRNGYKTFSITGRVFIRPQGSERLVETARGCVHDDIKEVIPHLAPFLKWHLVSEDGPLYYIENTVYLAGDRDCFGLRKGECRQLRRGGHGPLVWVLKADKELPEREYSDTRPEDTAVLRYVPSKRVGEGKIRDLDSARKTAVWPDATDEELMQEPKALKAALLARLPALMAKFKADIEFLGFKY